MILFGMKGYNLFIILRHIFSGGDPARVLGDRIGVGLGARSDGRRGFQSSNQSERKNLIARRHQIISPIVHDDDDGRRRRGRAEITRGRERSRITTRRQGIGSTEL